jgi:hypothetical protein
MDHLDDLPKRHENHATESKAEAAFSISDIEVGQSYSSGFGSQGATCCPFMK